MRKQRFNIAPAVTGTALKTMFLFTAPANQECEILSFGGSFAGTSTNVNILCEWLRFTNAGTMQTSLTGVAHDPGQDESLVGTAYQGATAVVNTVEPTRGGLLWEGYVNPAGSYGQVFSDRDTLIVAGGGFIGFSVTAPNSCSCCFWTVMR